MKLLLTREGNIICCYCGTEMSIVKQGDCHTSLICFHCEEGLVFPIGYEAIVLNPEEDEDGTFPTIAQA